MEKVLVVGKMHPKALDYLYANADVTIAEDTSTEGIIGYLKQGMKGIILRGYMINDEIIAGSTDLKVIARAAAGYDEINIPMCNERNIYVCNAPGANANATAEQTIALMFCLARTLIPMANMYAEGKFSIPGKTMFGLKKAYGMYGVELEGKVWGVMGFGRIGRMVADKALALGLKEIVIYDPFLPEDCALPEGMTLCNNLNEFMGQCDFVSLHMPLTDDTKDMINLDVLKMMKPSAFLVNEARGETIVEEDIAYALNNDIIAGAALDVNIIEPLPADHMFWNCKNIILTPHNGGYTNEADMNISMLAAINAVQGINGEVPQNCVNADQINKLQ